MGYFMLVGSNKYLNKMTTYAVGFDVTADIATYAPALGSDGARIDDELGSNELEFGHTGGAKPAAYDVATYPTNLENANVGETWAATMTTTTADVIDWTTNSLLAVCGDVTG